MLNSEMPKVHVSLSVLEVEEYGLSNVFEHDARNSRHGINRFFKVDQFCSEGRVTPLENSLRGFKELDIVRYNAAMMNKFFLT
jgi:hypothetical protein